MTAECTYESIYMARQPVFNEDGDTWGYMLLFRDSIDADRAVFADNTEATQNLLANLPLCSSQVEQGCKVMIHFTPEEIVKGGYLAVPLSSFIAILEEMPSPSDELVSAISELQEAGHELAINNFEGKPGCEQLAEMADMLIVDIHGKSRADLDRTVTQGVKLGASLLIAKRVEDKGDLISAQEAGFDLFNGYFFKYPSMESGRKITASEVTRLKLYEIIEKEEPDFDSLAAAIEADVSISYRLLNFLNSATFSFATTITSIRQAVVLAGWRPIRNWLRLIILTDLAPPEKTQELAYLSAHRAKLFETAALGGGYEDQSDKLFMLGLFSLLDAMLDMKMDDIVTHLPVDIQIKNALSRNQGRYAPWLRLAAAIEQSDWDAVGVAAKELDLLPGTVAVSYQHAYTWVDAFFYR